MKTADFWNNRSVVVTGGSGFLGRFVVGKLRKFDGVKVNVPRSVEFNLTKMEDVERMYDVMKPNIVIHLAAVVGGIGANMARPGDFFYQNMMMGTQLLDQARIRGIDKFVSIGTICAYPKFTPVPFKEEDLWNGYPEETNAPYGLAKKMLLVQGQAYRKQFNFNSIYLLLVNLFGPGDNFDPETSHVIPALIKKILQAKLDGDKEVVCWGTGHPTREFIYVEDAADAIIAATQDYDGDEPVNIGSGHEISIKDLSEKIAEVVQFKGTMRWDTTKADGQPRRCLDVSKAKRHFGFSAKTNLEDGLVKTVRWYERFLSGQHADDFSGLISKTLA